MRMSTTKKIRPTTRAVEVPLLRWPTVIKRTRAPTRGPTASVVKKKTVTLASCLFMAFYGPGPLVNHGGVKGPDQIMAAALTGQLGQTGGFAVHVVDFYVN